MAHPFSSRNPEFPLPVSLPLIAGDGTRSVKKSFNKYNLVKIHHMKMVTLGIDLRPSPLHT